ncbi:MAG: hypothetical protein VCF24_17250 [Candidatus Latescibacterota bacterium]
MPSPSFSWESPCGCGSSSGSASWRPRCSGYAAYWTRTRRGTRRFAHRTTDLEQATKAFISRREELHGRVLQDRERLTEMEERLERIRPKSHRVDSNPRDPTKDDWS